MSKKQTRIQLQEQLREFKELLIKCRLDRDWDALPVFDWIRERERVLGAEP